MDDPHQGSKIQKISGRKRSHSHSHRGRSSRRRYRSKSKSKSSINRKYSRSSSRSSTSSSSITSSSSSNTNTSSRTKSTSISHSSDIRRSRRRSRYRSYSRPRRRSHASRRFNNFNNNNKSENELFNSDFTALQRPRSEWACSICSNINSEGREVCFRCEVSFIKSKRTRPSEELRILYIPNETNFNDIYNALHARFKEYGESCNIIGYEIDIQNDSKTNTTTHNAHILFDRIEEATKALIYTRCKLLLGETMCLMEFAPYRRVKTKPEEKKKLNNNNNNSETTSCEANIAAFYDKKLPEFLQPEVWKPVEEFKTEEEEKLYLKMLTEYWNLLSQKQKDYYDNRVHRTLKAQHQRQQEEQQQLLLQHINSNTSSINTAASSVSAQAIHNDSNNTTNIAEDKSKQLEEKSTVGGDTSTNISQPTQGKTLSLKERLALKKTKIKAAKCAGETETEIPSGSATTPASPVSVASTCSFQPTHLNTQDITPVAPALFYGFPIPPQFPTKIDNISNTISPLPQAGISFRYVYPSVAERILPPSARPRST